MEIEKIVIDGRGKVSKEKSFYIFHKVFVCCSPCCFVLSCLYMGVGLGG